MRMRKFITLFCFFSSFDARRLAGREYFQVFDFLKPTLKHAFLPLKGVIAQNQRPHSLETNERKDKNHYRGSVWAYKQNMSKWGVKLPPLHGFNFQKTQLFKVYEIKGAVKGQIYRQFGVSFALVSVILKKLWSFKVGGKSRMILVDHHQSPPCCFDCCLKFLFEEGKWHLHF